MWVLVVDDASLNTAARATKPYRSVSQRHADLRLIERHRLRLQFGYRGDWASRPPWLWSSSSQGSSSQQYPRPWITLRPRLLWHPTIAQLSSISRSVRGHRRAESKRKRPQRWPNARSSAHQGTARIDDGRHHVGVRRLRSQPAEWCEMPRGRRVRFASCVPHVGADPFKAVLNGRGASATMRPSCITP
jgi:hypothetical protein